MKIDVEKVLALAAEEFARAGFDAMSMRVLARKCGISAPALYYHFSSKEELFHEVFNTLQDNVLTKLDAALLDAASPEQRIEIYISTLFDAWAEGPLQLLIQRDAVAAGVDPAGAMAQIHFQRLLDHAGKIFQFDVKTAINPRAAYSFASLVFGYVSLLPYDQLASGLQRDHHRELRKRELIAMCHQILRVRTGT